MSKVMKLRVAVVSALFAAGCGDTTTGPADITERSCP
jgi:hypothetical protein